MDTAPLSTLLVEWQSRLHELENQSPSERSWSAPIEARVLRFLLSRYGTEEPVKVELPKKRPLLMPSRWPDPRPSLSVARRRWCLRHLAQVRHEVDTRPRSFWEQCIEDADKSLERSMAASTRRRMLSKSRGYW